MPISPATAQLLFVATGYPPISPANPRAATQLYDHGQPAHANANAVLNSLL